MKLNLYTIGKRIEALGRAIADIAPALERAIRLSGWKRHQNAPSLKSRSKVDRSTP